MAVRPSYMPILRAKRGESLALRKLAKATRAAILPLIDVPRIDMNWEEGRPKKTLETHLEDKAKEIARMHGKGAGVLVDVFDLPLHETTSDGHHPVTHLANQLRGLGIQMIPTVGMDRDQPFLEAVKKVAGRERQGACVRVLSEDIELAHTLGREVRSLLRAIEVEQNECHVVLDLRSLLDADLDRVVGRLQRALIQFGNLADWRSVSLAGCGLPRVASEILEAGELGLVPRPEVELFDRLDGSRRGLTFGDYATVHPDLIYEDPRKLARNMGPNIKYTLARSWLLLRGHSFRRHPEGRKQYYSLARTLVSRPEFMGSAYSFGDAYAAERATGAGGPGSPQTWVTMAVNHHLTLTAAQQLQLAH